MPKKILNLVMVLVLIIAMLMGLTACGNKKESEEEIKEENKVEDFNDDTLDALYEGIKEENKVEDFNDDLYYDDELEAQEISDEEWEILSFNSRFEMYVGNALPATEIVDLLDMVVENNSQNSRKIEIEMNKKTISETKEIQELQSSVEDSKEYTVSLEYDAEGYVNQIIIE